ncbi:MAG TPA: acetyl-CoA carboxylase biotin carboxyl carrier protein [Cyclobacteriaceae bacterium]
MAKSRAKTTPKKTAPVPDQKKAPGSSKSVTTGEIRDLIEFIANTGLNEVSFETPELKLHVKRQPDQRIAELPASAAPAQTVILPQTTAAPPAPEPAAPASRPTVEIRSPMIGTFYRSPNPDSPPFVSVGDKITKGQTVCIIEAMKLFNEIESEVSGTIVKVLVENATPVEYDQPLYLVEPD